MSKLRMKNRNNGRKTKKQKNKVVKRRSLVIAFFLINGRFLLWLAKWLCRRMRTNALLVVGFCLFTISFGFFAFNALFSQIKIYQDVVTQMKTIPLSVKVKDSVSSKKRAIDQADVRVISALVPSHLRPNSSSQPLPSTSPENLLNMQKKLAKLGFYDGPLDGLDGPRMRHAIALWKQQMQREPLPKRLADEISMIIEKSELEVAKIQ
ncbi:peptidoglycan-binding domain-containing protein [Bartonella sp. A05]|uniref:peptidoglycan-binding domain-containing protein n=1 Tax=Bartonella sp. A05 TaxID=2967261 RepID=UPI0022A9AADF|nr:peptidoglycan-binding protein [Bartonella sp. A05]MCZ2203857.1 hypothetical protein [Bartonella sp. A05]